MPPAPHHSTGLILIITALATFGCDDPGLEAELEAADKDYEDSEGEASEGEDDELRVSNGAIVLPYGGSEGITRTIVRIGGCTGTLVDNNRWVLTAKHCGITVGAGVLHASTGQWRSVDQVVDHPAADNDATLLRLDQTLDVEYDGGVVTRGRTTAELVGDTVTCMGYGAMDYGATCSSNADCQAGEVCEQNARCLTPSADLRRGDLLVAAVSANDKYFFTPRNALDQLTLPGDSGGPCWSRRDATSPAGLTGDGQLLELQGVNSSWYYDVSGNDQLNVGTFADWIHWETRGSGIARYERPVNNQLHAGTFTDPSRPNRYVRDFVFVAPHTGTVDVTMNSAQIDPYLYVLDAGLGVIAQNDDATGYDSRITVNVVQGQTYYLRASSYGQWEQGTFTLMIADKHLAPGVAVAGTFSNTDDLNPARPSRYKDDYWFFAPSVGRYAFTLDATGNPAVDTYLQLVHATRDGAVITFDDDGGPGYNSRIEVDLREGEGLWVRATTYGAGATGSYSVRATKL